MYPAPPVIKTEVFARIPDKFRKRGQLSAERLAAGKGNANTDSFIEGPSFDSTSRISRSGESSGSNRQATSIWWPNTPANPTD